MVSRHFKHRHPLFRKASSATGTYFNLSPYFFWWEFLRRHDEYRKTCLKNGFGKCSELYKDFGDVHSQSFKDWWSENDRGAKLFAEPIKPIGLGFIDPSEIDAITSYVQNGTVGLLTVPFTMDKKSLLVRFQKLIRKVHPRQRGQRYNTNSYALYPIISQYTIISLKKTLEAYDLKNGSESLTLWEIGQKLRLGDILTKEELNLKRGQITPTVKNKQNQLAVAASKKIRIAKSIIDGVGRGIFPKYQ